MPNPWDGDPIVSPAQQQWSAIAIPQSPAKKAEAARQADAERRANAAADREAKTWAAKHNPDGTEKVEQPKMLGDESMHGADYLATLPNNIRSRVQQLLDGRSILTAREKGQPIGQQLMDAANQADPTFDEAASHARFTARTQFTGMGKASSIVQAGERLANHASHAAKLSAELGGPDLGFSPLSNAAGYINSAFHQKQATAYSEYLPVLAGEVQKLTKLGTATVDESKHIMEGLQPHNPKVVRDAALAELLKMADAQRAPLKQAWESAWAGSTAPPMPMDFSPATNAVVDAVNSGDSDPFKTIVGGVGGANAAPPHDGGNGSGPLIYGKDPTPPPIGGGPMPGQLTIDDYASPTSGGPEHGAGGWLRGPEYRQEYDTAYQKKADAMFRSGASFDQMNQFAIQSGYGGINQGEYMKAHAERAAYAKAHGGREYNGSAVNAPLKPVAQTWGERASQGVPGGAAIGAANAGSFGALDLIDPKGMDLARQTHPFAEGAGEIGGAIYGMKGMGRLTGGLLRNNLPQYADGVSAYIAAHPNIAMAAGDTGYSAARGFASNPDDPSAAMKQTALGMAGSAAGIGLGSVVGRAIGGVQSSPIIQRLREAGVTPTIGQIFRGRAADNGGKSLVAALEDVVGNTPGANMFVNGARNRALEQGNTAAHRMVTGDPTIEGTGIKAVNQSYDATSKAYGDVLDGASVPKNDPQFIGEFENAANDGAKWDQARGRKDFGTTLDMKLRPIVGGPAPEITGDQLQQSLRLMKGQQRAYNKAATGVAPDPSAAYIADAFGGVGDAFTNAAGRANPGIIPGLQRADRMYHDVSLLDNAAGAASGEGGVFTGAQLLNQIKSDKFGGGRSLSGQNDSRLFQHAQDMNAVLPNKVPPTGVNLAPILATAGLAGEAGNESSGLDSNALRVASLVAMVSSPYTKPGAKAIAKLLLDRPDVMRTAGTAIRNNKSVFGVGMAPVGLAYGQQ